MVGLALQAALSRQRRVLDATERTRAFLGDLIVSNATAINQHVSEIGDVYRNPVVAIEKLNQAHNALVEALDTAGRLEAEGIEIAKANIARLRQLTAEISERATGMNAREESSSVEA
jgi:uncharacterized protein YaaN involved in tellurite resistance